jgi:putative NADPH-quinone reductase
LKKKFRHLIIIGHPDQKSFCYNGIFKTIIRQMNKHKEVYMVIDLYDDKLHNDRDDLIKKYQDLITWSTHIYIVSPVWWFRLTPKLETFFDHVIKS